MFFKTHLFEPNLDPANNYLFCIHKRGYIMSLPGSIGGGRTIARRSVGSSESPVGNPTLLLGYIAMGRVLLLSTRSDSSWKRGVSQFLLMFTLGPSCAPTLAYVLPCTVIPLSAKDLTRLEAIAKRMRELDVTPSPVTLGILVKTYGQAGDAQKVLQVWSDMDVQRRNANAKTYGCMIDACVKCGHLDKAVEIFVDMKKEGEHKNTILYTTLIKGYGLEKDLPKALSLCLGASCLRLTPKHSQGFGF